MSLSDFPELAKLPNAQKLTLADELWRSGVSDSMPVPSEHKKVLDSRWADYRAGKIKRISMAELERRVSKK
jgi:putative addiction module component (TIGR02574 family)